MAQRRMAATVLSVLLLACLWLQPIVASAAQLSPIDTQQDCDLTISYRCDGAVADGETVLLFQVADVSSAFVYTLTEPFAASGLQVNGVQTNGEWNVIRSTLESYILAGNIQPVQYTIINEDGEACFTGLKPGLYLASAVETPTCFFDSALVALPGLEDDVWQYQVAIAAKPQLLPPITPDEKEEWKILKLWKNDSGQIIRPQSIEVDIYRNGKLHSTVVLSEETQWSCSWTAPKDGSQWKVVERNVPKGYTVTVQARETTFIVTNTYTPEKPTPPPKTGDTSNIMLYAICMYVSGGMLILLGIIGRRKRHEETN